MTLLKDLWPLALLVLLTTVGIEWGTRREKFPYWIGRKVLHVLAVGACALAPVLTGAWTELIILVAVVEVLLLFLVSTNRLLGDELGRPAWGIVWFPLAYLLLLDVYSPDEPWRVALPMTILALADPAATIVGKLFGKRIYYLTGEPKSLAGNAAFFGVCATSLVILLPIDVSPLTLFTIAIILTVHEALGSYGSDNLLVPLAAAWWLSPERLAGSVEPLLILILLGIPFVWFCYRRGKLTLGGAVVAVLLALYPVAAADSWLPLLPILFFFGSSVLLEKLLPSGVASDFKDGQPRDVSQVLINGGLYVACYVFYPAIGEQIGSGLTNEVASPDQSHQGLIARFLITLSLAILAVSTADTWAATVGKKFGGITFDPFRWQRVPPGLSGGMSVAGSLAGLAGSVAIACFLFVLLPDWPLLWIHFGVIVAAGFGGMLLDSWLGSWFQLQFFYHGRWFDAMPRRWMVDRVRGLWWMTNDVVNLLSVLLTAGLLIWLFFRMIGGLG